MRTGNGFPLGLEEKWSHRVKSRAKRGEEKQEKEQRDAFLISSGIHVCIVFVFDNRLAQVEYIFPHLMLKARSLCFGRSCITKPRI